VRVAASALALGTAVLLSGCFATTKHVQTVETDITRQKAWTDERFQEIQNELEAAKSENETLRLRVDDLSDRLAALREEVGNRLADLSDSDERVLSEVRRTRSEALEEVDTLESTREADRAEMLDRMNTILEEVLAENNSLRERLTRLEEGAFTFGRMHKVKQGESIASIASQYGVTAEEIVRANDLPNANLIQVGQELLIPGTGP
jgi:chromosome segregation ATPase